MRKRALAMLMMAGTLSLAGSAKSQAGAGGDEPGATGRLAQGSRQPYTAEYKISSAKTRASGATTTQEFTETRAADAQGRVMIARMMLPSPGHLSVRTHFSVVDPVARTISDWDSPGRKATVTAMRASDTHPTCPPIAAFEPSAKLPEPVVVDLGTETIQGVEARGRRSTTTIPAGMAGNDATLVSTGEVWIAITPGLRGLVVRQILDDPQAVNMTKELVKLNQTDPDAAVFKPPAGYKIVQMGAPGPVCEIRHTVVEPPSPQE